MTLKSFGISSCLKLSFQCLFTLIERRQIRVNLVFRLLLMILEECGEAALNVVALVLLYVMMMLLLLLLVMMVVV